MNLTAPQREQLRLSLLRFLDATPTRSTSLALLAQYARSEGRAELTAAEVEAELVYLHDKFLVEPAMKEISPENHAWRITAKGRDAYAEFQS